MVEEKDRMHDWEKISVNLPRWMREYLEREARMEGESLSTIVRRAIRKYIGEGTK